MNEGKECIYYAICEHLRTDSGIRHCDSDEDCRYRVDIQEDDDGE